MTVANHPDDITTRAAAAQTAAELARVLRDLRRRDSRVRRRPEVTYREIADQTGWSIAVIGGYLTGTKVASPDRFDVLVQLLGASAHELGVLATARDRVADLKSATSTQYAGAPLRNWTPTAPHMLPPRVFGFTGRREELARLDGVLAHATAPGTVMISAIAGMGGVGKSALAVHWAHSAAGHFPDGELYLNLRGFDVNEPLTVSAALGIMIGALGVEAPAVPTGVEDRRALYHRLLAQRRMLVLLDNASGSTQVRPLLPPPPCLALVTSRDDLADLTTMDGARQVALDPLPADDAGSLLSALIGDRAAREPDALQALSEHCGRLPLALRVAAEDVASRPLASLTELVKEFGAQRSHAGLAAFENTGDSRTDMREVFSWSVRHLSQPAARAFLLLGLVPGADIDGYGLAALVGGDLAESERLAGTMLRAHLIEPSGADRFTMHDLLREYAATATTINVDDRRAALARLLDYYLAAATAAVSTKFASGSRLAEHAALPPESPLPDVSTWTAATTWLTTERANLVRACVDAARRGLPEQAVSLALTLRPFLDDGHDDDSLTVHGAALAATQELGSAGDPINPARLRTCLAITNWRLGNLDVAESHARQALDTQTQHEDAAGATVSLAILGVIRASNGRYRESIECHLRGLELARSSGIRKLEANQLKNLAFVHIQTEEFEAALDWYKRAEAVFGEVLGQHPARDATRGGLARAYLGLGRLDEALPLIEEALAAAQASGRVLARVETIPILGSVYRRLGRTRDAQDLLMAALADCRELDNAAVTAAVLNVLGETQRDLGCAGEATESHEEAHELAERAGHRLEATRALVGMGDALADAGDTERARECWQAAFEAYSEMGLPGAMRLSDRLAGAGDRWRAVRTPAGRG